jgi:antitoxin (DNA-binding transcriptional repressor) of toxin-antitoxin stability system
MDPAGASNEPPRVGLRELRHDARTWVERAKAGERVYVTDRGRVVAEIVPHQPARSAIDRLIADGRLIPAQRRFRPRVFSPGPASRGLSETLQRMRDEERL